MNNITKVLKEAIQSVLPIFGIVLLLSVTVASMGSGVVVTFLFGTLFGLRIGHRVGVILTLIFILIVAAACNNGSSAKQKSAGQYNS